MKKNACYIASVFAVCLLLAACDDELSYYNPNIVSDDSLTEDSLEVNQTDSSQKPFFKDFLQSLPSSAQVSSSSQYSEPYQPEQEPSSSSYFLFDEPAPESSSSSYQFNEPIEVIPSSSSKQMSTECENIRATRDQFHQLTDVVNCVMENEKVAYVIRHAERNKSSTGTEGRLNDNGREQSITLGERLAPLGPIYFMHTKVYRTMETVLKIAEGKGQEFSESSIPFTATSADDHEQRTDLLDSYFIKDESQANACKNQHSWSWSAYSYFAYEEDVSRECQAGFYDVDDRIQEFIKDNFTYSKMHDITIAISHDQFLIPFIISVSERNTIDLRFHKHENEESRYDYWINYLTGVAIIVDENDQAITIPVTAMEDPYLRVFPEK